LQARSRAKQAKENTVNERSGGFGPDSNELPPGLQSKLCLDMLGLALPIARQSQNYDFADCSTKPEFKV
jgi:hypothetical protein